MPVELFHILPLQKENLPSVLSIERQSYPHPWSAEQFIQELNNPISSVDLLWIDEQLAGYICYWLIAGEAQILNLATASEFRRRGVAGQLLEHCFACCRKKGLTKVWLEVRMSNQAAIDLYLQQGFVADVVRSGYYRDGEDALLMARDFTGVDSAGL